MSFRKQVEFAFQQHDDWTDSQMKSPVFKKLQQVLPITWGDDHDVVIFTCSFGLGKTIALRDIEAQMRIDNVPVLFLDARLAVNLPSASHFLDTSLGLPVDVGWVY